jgi:MFS transporter, UMF1 family
LIRRKDLQAIQQGDKRVIRGWVMYDWANSVYQLTITTAIFPLFYNKVTAVNPGSVVDFFGISIVNTVLYSYTIAAAYLVVALFSPLLSSFADYTGRRKAFMAVFTWIGAISCGMLFFFDGHNVGPGIITFGLATLGYAGSIVFYNSFLPVIVAPDMQDRVSARGYSMGYLGSVLLLLFNIFMIFKPGLFGIPEGSTLPHRISFISVFLWWIGFSQITFSRLPRYTFRKRTEKAALIVNGYRELRVVFNYVRKSFTLSIFLTGFFFMMMGLITIMFMAASFGEKEMHLPDEVLIPTVLGIQLVGIAGAWSFARLSGKIGNFRALIIALVMWVFICIGGYYITGAAGFITTAFFIGIVMGGTQSLARSTYSKLLPETTDHTSFFSFYDVMEKSATVIGLTIFGYIEASNGSMRYSVMALGIFFVVGLFFMLMLVRKVR